jgi:hypothetical protein
MDESVGIGTMYLIVTATVAAVMIAYVLLNKFKGGKAKAK